MLYACALYLVEIVCSIMVHKMFACIISSSTDYFSSKTDFHVYIYQMIEADKLQVKDLRHQGYSEGQLQELGFPKVALGQAPSVLKAS